MPTNNMNPMMQPNRGASAQPNRGASAQPNRPVAMPMNKMRYDSTGAAMAQAMPSEQLSVNRMPQPQREKPADYTVRLNPAHREITIKLILD